jgi:hypothetical protein
MVICFDAVWLLAALPVINVGLLLHAAFNFSVRRFWWNPYTLIE